MNDGITATALTSSTRNGIAYGQQPKEETAALLRRFADDVESGRAGIYRITVAETAQAGRLVYKALVIRFHEKVG